MLMTASFGYAQEIQEVKPREKGEMKFEHTRHNFGVFAVDTAIVTHEFVFTNVGKAPLIIHQANASCGCTVPEYTLEPIKPGEKGKITVTYNGKGRRPGVFRKSITVHISYFLIYYNFSTLPPAAVIAASALCEKA